jgi:hypothetical protein
MHLVDSQFLIAQTVAVVIGTAFFFLFLYLTLRYAVRDGMRDGMREAPRHDRRAVNVSPSIANLPDMRAD